MLLILSPCRTDERLVLSLDGDVLTFNGETLDLSTLAEGATLPAGSITGPQSHWIAGDIRRLNGELFVPIKNPHGWPAPQAALYPADINVSTDGPIDLPEYEEQSNAN